MKKKFNVTGICLPKYHYMMDTTQKMKEIMYLIDGGDYFTINRPRQYGKTTTLRHIQQTLAQRNDFICLKLSFEDVSAEEQQSAQTFAHMFARHILLSLKSFPPNIKEIWHNLQPHITDLSTLSESITQWITSIQKKVVLLIDEVDASGHYASFLNFLAMLRKKYLNRYEEDEATFHSVVLAGVHDVKTLKFKMRSPQESKYNSPWNIATDFEIDMSFNPTEIAAMLKEYKAAEGVTMNTITIATKIHDYTAGYPFLVSKLCKIIAEKILPKQIERTWTANDVDTAVQQLLKKSTTNFDSLIKNLENHPRLYDLVYRMLINGEKVPFNPHEPLLQLGQTYGIFAFDEPLKIHNQIYTQRIYDYMTVKTIVQTNPTHNYAYHFLLDNNALDMEGVLRKFQQFMKEQYSTKSKDFIEHHGRILFLAFLTPILNGQGHAFREVQTSLEKRLDIIVTYFQHQYIIELKRWYGPKAHKQGLNQLADYLDIHGQQEGFLVIFDDRKKKTWTAKPITHQGKTIFAVWV